MTDTPARYRPWKELRDKMTDEQKAELDRRRADTPAAKSRPTLEQLESILNTGGEVPIEILPNGEVRAKRIDTPMSTPVVPPNPTCLCNVVIQSRDCPECGLYMPAISRREHVAQVEENAALREENKQLRAELDIETHIERCVCSATYQNDPEGRCRCCVEWDNLCARLGREGSCG